MKPASIGILHYTAPPVVGGVEAVIQAHTDVFSKHGHPVRVITGRGELGSLPSGVELVAIPAIDSQHPAVVEISAALEAGTVPAQFDSMAAQLAQAIAPSVADVENLIVHNVFTKHFNLPLTAALHRLLDENMIQRCIAWCHDFTWTSPSSRSKVHPGFPWDTLRTQRADTRYVVVSKQRQAALAELFSCPPDEIHVAYNGVDPAVIFGLTAAGQALVDRLELLDQDLILLMPVRVTRAKNIEFALRVVAALKATGCRPKLVLTGPPDPHDPENMSYYAALKALRADLGLEEEMRFIYESGPHDGDGWTIGPALVGELYRVSDLVLMPSHREGFGMPVLEAGLAGVPVVASEIPAALEIGRDEVILIGESRSPEEVAEMIRTRITERPIHRLRRRVRKSFTWEAIYRDAILPLLGQSQEPA